MELPLTVGKARGAARFWHRVAAAIQQRGVPKAVISIGVHCFQQLGRELLVDCNVHRLELK